MACFAKETGDHRLRSTFSFFWAIVKLCGIQLELVFFTSSCSCNIECMLLQEMPKDAFIIRCVTWRSCIISSRTASMFSDRTVVFGGPSWTSSFSDSRAQLNSLKQFFTVLWDGALSPNKDLSSWSSKVLKKDRTKMLSFSSHCTQYKWWSYV